MRTTFLLVCLFASMAQAQTPSPTQLAQSLNGGTTTRPAPVYSSQPTVVAAKNSGAMDPGTALLAKKQYTATLSILYSSFYQFGIFGAGDFYKIRKAANDEADEWPLLIETVVRGLLKQAGKKVRNDEDFFLRGDDGVRNLNNSITNTKADPYWQDLFKTANSLRRVDDDTPNFKESGGFSAGLQITASSPLIDPNGTPNYTRVITSFPFTVR